MNKRFLLSVIIVLGLTCFLSVSAFDLADLLAGPGWTSDGDGFYGFDIIQWLLIFLPVYGFGLREFESMLNRAHLYVHRYQNVRNWWFHVLRKNIFEIVILYLVMGLSIRLLAWNIWTDKMTMSVFFIFIHALFCLTFSIWVRILSGNMILASVVLVLLEVMAKMAVVMKILTPAFSPFSWGMYHYTVQNYGVGGFPVVSAVIIQLCMVCSLAVLVCGRGKVLLLRRIQDGKVH